MAVDAVSQSSEVSGVTSITWAHTCSGANRALVVCVKVRHSNAVQGVPTGVTYNGVAMTLEASVANASAIADFGSGPVVSQWSLIAPATGANNVVVTFSNAISVSATGVAISFTDADQTDCVDATNSATGSVAATSVSVTPTAANAIVVDALYHLDSGPLSVGAGQTSRSNRTVNGGGDTVGVSTEAVATPASTAMTWTAAIDAYWSATAVSVKAAAAAGTILPEMMAQYYG